MSTGEHKAVVRRLFDAFNERDFNALTDLISPAFVDRTPAPGQAPGAAGVLAAWTWLSDSFPGIRIVLEDLVAEEDRCAVRGRFEVVPSGGGEPRPIGTLMEFIRFEAGQIVELWNLLQLA